MDFTLAPLSEISALAEEAGGNRSAAAVVADALRTGILHHALRGGERLRQDAVASRFNVSQMIVREAFKQLATEGFVKVEPRRGVSVAMMSADEAWEMTQLRCLIEAQALRWAIPNMSKADFDKGRKILNQLDVAKTVDQKISLNAAFHEMLYNPAAKERTLNLIANLRVNFERYLRFTWEKTFHLERSQREHRQILKLCEAADIDNACAALRDHILATGDVLVSTLQENAA